MECRKINGFGGNYYISVDGIVTTDRRQGSAGGEVKQRLNSNGYYCVTLQHKGHKKTALVHRLVAEAFIDNPENKPCVNHKDGNKDNNTISNLEWCTYSENMKHAIKTGLSKMPGLHGESHPNAKLTQAEVDEIRAGLCANIPPRILAKVFHVTPETIYNIRNGKVWRCTE